MVAINGFIHYFEYMISRLSKLLPSLVGLIACAGVTSCSLFRDGKYASQWEVETEVPDSLDGGKPSQGPSAEQVAARQRATIPSDSNLADLPSMDTQLPRTNGPLLSEGSGIPKPNFDSPARSIHPELLDVPPPGSTPNGIDTELPQGSSGIASISESKLEPLTTDSSPPAALPPANPPIDPAPGVPLLHGATRLSDFYASMHQGLLDGDTVQNQTVIPDPLAPPPSAASSVPPPSDVLPAPVPPTPGQ